MTITSTIEDAVRALDINVVSNNGQQIKGYCPVHKRNTGHEDQHPSWYINATTGAWYCFSCQGRGSLSHLIEAMGGDVEGVADLIIENAAEQARSLDGPAPEPEPVQYVSERLFAKNPYPHPAAMERRDLDLETCKRLNIRWDRQGMCWLLPMYDFGARLIGWQEKSAGYFNNYPTGLRKSASLFGYQAIAKAKTVVLVESQLDAARFFRYNMEAIAQMGSGLSKAQAEAIDKLRPALVVIAMDNDKAGDGAAAIATELLRARSIDVAYFRYPRDTRDQDPGDLPAEDLKEGVARAMLAPPPDIAERIRR
jgi:DNA primase